MYGNETGAGDGLAGLLGTAISGEAIQGSVESLLIATLQDEQVRAELAAAVRPVVMEAAAYVTLGVAAVILVWQAVK
jgi:hypothetical protein|tara:strand:- start:10 stop:240 length:231 start_codon:yes stop_codon:yes gene_type:complete